MKTTLKKSSRGKAARLELVSANGGRAVVPLKERRLNFGGKWDYAPAPEDSKNYVIAPRHELFINGKFVAPRSKKYFDSLNPATEQKLTEIAAGNAADVDNAVKSARRAYENVWSKMPGRERGKYLYRIARIIQEKARELAVLETMDGGKTIKESRDVDLPLVAAHFFYYAGWADKLKYAFPGKTPQPLGVAGQIIPWNFPLLMAAWKIAPALACGNTVVLKPAETTSVTAMALSMCCLRLPGDEDSSRSMAQSLSTYHPCRPRRWRNYHPCSNQLPRFVTHRHPAARPEMSARPSGRGCRHCRAS